MRIIQKIIGALGKAMAPAARPGFRKPFVKITDADVEQVLLRCRTDLPPAAGLFWFAVEDMPGHPAILTLIQQSPKKTDWWALHTEQTIDAWMAHLPSTASNRGKQFRKTFESLARCPEPEKIDAISVLFSFLMRPGSLTTFPMARVMLADSPAPAIDGAADMRVSDAFIPKRSREQPLGVWMPMFRDVQGRTHDVMDTMLLNAERLAGAVGIVQDFSPFSQAEKDGYLARHMARYSDVLHEDLIQKAGVVVPGLLPDAGMVQAMLLANVCLPSTAWSMADAKEVESRSTWRPPLMLLLTTSATAHGSSMPTAFFGVVQRLKANGHDVMGKGLQPGPSAARSLMYFAEIKAHEAVALMLRMGADPDEMVSTTRGLLSVREFVADMKDERMAHLLTTQKNRSTARSILDEIDSDNDPRFTAFLRWERFLSIPGSIGTIGA